MNVWFPVNKETGEIDRNSLEWAVGDGLDPLIEGWEWVEFIPRPAPPTDDEIREWWDEWCRGATFQSGTLWSDHTVRFARHAIGRVLEGEEG